MPVPASYNDLTTEHELRDHVGTVWYDRKFFVPERWATDQRIWLRFGSVHYEAFVVSFEQKLYWNKKCIINSLQQWINGEKVVEHEMGHLPFEAEITKWVKPGLENRITVLCDNALIQSTVPQGKITEVAK